MLRTLDISASALAAQRLRVDAIAGNIAHSHTTLNEAGETEPFQRRLVVLEAANERHSTPVGAVGVQATVEIDTNSPPRKVYEPGHPHADPQGYVNYPNVDVSVEMVNLVAAQRAYDANVAVVVSDKRMRQKALEILQA